MRSKPLPPSWAATRPPKILAPVGVSVRGCTWALATLLCAGVWVGIGELIFG